MALLRGSLLLLLWWEAVVGFSGMQGSRCLRVPGARRTCWVSNPRSRVMMVDKEDKEDDDAPPEISGDVRDFRAKLVAQQKGLEFTPDTGKGWVYETPVIEQGSVILGGLEQSFGFGLRQQYFHKCVMLVLQHDDTFTKGVILNRPTARKLDGWDVWFGGDVAEGGMFREQPVGPQETTCLHQLESEEAARLSLPVIKGIYQTTFTAAKALVKDGHAKKEDFWLFVGNAGWAPKQLQGELDRKSWYLAAADSSVLLGELIRQAADPSSLPILDSEGGLSPGGDGLGTWETLIQAIGRDDLLSSSQPLPFDDLMLREWVRVHLLDPFASTAATSFSVGDFLKGKGGGDQQSVPPGTLLRSRLPSSFVLDKQYLHKALVLVLEDLPEGALGIVLNRPSSNAVQFSLPGIVGQRLVCFGGELQLGGGSNVLWLHKEGSKLLGGSPVGDSGVFRIPAREVVDVLQKEQAKVHDFLLVSGLLAWPKGGLEQEIVSGKFEVVDNKDLPWEALLGLLDVDVEYDPKVDQLSDGKEVWELLRSMDDGNDKDAHAMLADEALEKWLEAFLRPS